MAKKTKIRNAQVGEGRRGSLKSRANKAIESFTISIKALIHRTSILTLSSERGRGVVRDRKKRRNLDGRGK